MINDQDDFDLIVSGCIVRVVREDSTPWVDSTIASSDHLRQTIYIDNKLRGAWFWRTLVHEIIHLLVAFYELPIEKEIEESVAGTISTCFVQLLRDNPELSKEMMK